MKLTFRTFKGSFGVSEDYILLHNFLVKSKNTSYTYARLDWMITHKPYLEEQYLCKIGMWFDGDELVASDLFDTTMDDIFPITLKGYESLYPEMIEYAQKKMVRKENPNFRIFIDDSNIILQKVVAKAGFKATESKDMVACFDFDDTSTDYKLPKGFSVVSLQDEKHYRKYLLCLHKGFDHEENGEKFEYNQEIENIVASSMERKFVDLSLKIAVKAPDGEFVSYCGIWYDKNSDFALIEPVATVPKYRKMGLGKAAVLEALHRVFILGANFAVVGSNQQFYYSIGLRPYTTGTFWTK